ncbi:hypothetical protein CSB45_10600 [candidate division KSB3 bacterium]|uniref:LPS export ABC transporter permease LptG n=1 Tax=candidate division KSB3 bacterium TaxID=2044937 RepID=A0A2G6E3M9_9BACT|nr:MAG: hypothetical protein CSB45_10600 [candidate division KSB3 bacterium]PIE29137.1 MAG: hypothetical protein CSA57_10025 [candidate division KSB3 bacterium]
MKILDRYIIREFLKMLILGITALILVATVVAIFERVDTIVEHKPSIWVVTGYFLTRIPQDVFMIAPISMLLTTLIITGAFARNSEIVAMMAGGVSVYRIMMPILAIGVVMSLAMFGLNEFVIPISNRVNMELWRIIREKPDMSQMAKTQIWFRGRREHAIRNEHENRIYYINALIPARRSADGKLHPPEIQSLTVFELNDQFIPIARLDAARAVYQRSKNEADASVQAQSTVEKVLGDLAFWKQEETKGQAPGRWSLYNGSQRKLGTDVQSSRGITTFRELHDYVIPWTFEDFRRDRKSPEDMNYRELKEYIQMLTDSGFDVSEYIVDLRAKFSYPFVSFVMVIIGFPFALKSPRNGAAFGVGLSVFIGLTFWILLQLGVSLGHAHILPPTLAVWIAHVLFASAGFYLILSTRT